MYSGSLMKKKCVITVLSPLDRLRSIFKKMGFNILIMNYRVVFLINFFNFFHKSLFRIEKNSIYIKKKLNNSINESFVKAKKNKPMNFKQFQKMKNEK